MSSWRDPDDEKLPYRASIDHDVYLRCGAMYNSYFEDLESLGPLEIGEDASVSSKDNARNIKVGAKPLSGVRGIYYTRGTWRVQYRGNGQEIVSCVFNYDNKEVLIATFDLAFKLLRRVIKLGRQIKKEDGMIIGELTEDRLLDLDRRSRMRTSKQSIGLIRDPIPVSSKRVSRPRQDYDSDGYESESELSYSAVRRKSRPASERIEPYSDPEYRNTPHSCGMGSDMSVAPDMNYYVGKLSSFERQFQSYGHFTTHALISFLIDEGCMRNSERTESTRQTDLYYVNDTPNGTPCHRDEVPSLNTYARESPELYSPYVPHLTSLDDANALYNHNTGRAQFEVEDGDIAYPLQHSVRSPSTGLLSSCDELIAYDNAQIPQCSLSGDEASPHISPEPRPEVFNAPQTETTTNHNTHECFASFYGYSARYPRQ